MAGQGKMDTGGRRGEDRGEGMAAEAFRLEIGGGGSGFRMEVDAQVTVEEEEAVGRIDC